VIKIRFPGELPEEIKEWKNEAERITKLILQSESLEKKHELINKYQFHWRSHALIKWLSELSHDKCWYTETKFGGDYQEVEHFRPKKGTKNKDGSSHPTHPGYYWLAFELDNYRLCKRRPNLKKSTYFPILDERNRSSDENYDWRDELPLFLDPLDEEDFLLLSFNDDGRPVPQEKIEKQDVERVKFTIEKYDLDEEVLNKRRKETWLAARELYNLYLNTMKEVKSKPNDSVRLRAEAKKDLARLKGMLLPTEEFSAVAKAALIKTGDEMAINIVAHV